MDNTKEELRKIKAFAFDVDGVFSDSTIFLYPDGEMMRSMNIKDGYAVQYAVKKGFPVAIISGGDSEAVRTRFRKLGVNDIYLKSSDKVCDFHDFLRKNNLEAPNVLYMGDDIPDYEVMQLAGFRACPADAAEEIKSIAYYISDKSGGKGCVRDVIEQVMKLQGKWLEMDAFHW
jgi:3-deoxy-D-manno-octulosonate 8-phosphate phosphatase (KDO 8-P phosphatase)